MPTPLETVNAFQKAVRGKDRIALRDILHPQYTARCPLATLTSRDEAIEAMLSCPMEYRYENSVYVTEGDRLVHVFDWVVEAPFQGRFRIAQYFQFEAGQIRSIEMIYDTAAFPPEFLAEVEQMRKEKEAVTA